MRAKTKEEIEAGIADIKSKYGDWFFDVPLPHDVWTRGKLNFPHTRLKRMVQVAADLCGKPLSECRVLDLACLDGGFAIEFALHGAGVVGIEIREDNIVKGAFCKEVLGLDKLTFIKDDVRNISVAKNGKFDIIICSGILYHLTADAIFNMIEKMFEMTERLVIIDTHISVRPVREVTYKGHTYLGHELLEHSEKDSQEIRAKKLWASWDNTTSFWFTRPSLINLLSRTGFSSIYECFVPAHLNFGKPGLETTDRCTFVAVKGTVQNILVSPAVNTLREDWPEGTLSYSDQSANNGASKAVSTQVPIKTILKKIFWMK